jgi:ethanolamine utilization protein EutM
MQDAIGLLETRGLVALVEATDAMAKAANVEIAKRIQIGGGLVTTVVRGDVGSVRAAVEAGANAARQAGELVASHIIPRPADGVIKAYLS